MDFNQVTDKPHAVCIPFPAQGHITPMLIKLAKLLHFKGFHITFVNTEYNHKRLLKSRGSSSLDGLTDFRFEAIPDGLPETDESDATQDIPSAFESTAEYCSVPVLFLMVVCPSHLMLLNNLEFLTCCCIQIVPVGS